MARSLGDVLSSNRHLTDAVTHQSITDDSKLVALHQHEDALLHDLVRVTRRRTACILLFHDGVSCPPSESAQAYRIDVSFNRLLMAPAIRLQVEWPACGLVVAIECRLRFAHLAAGDYFDEYTNIRQSLTFHTRPGCLSSEGLNIAQKHFPSLDPASQQLLFRLWELMGSTVSWKIQVVMLATESSVSQLLPYVIGPDRLPSLLEQDWAMYRPLSLDRTPLQLVTCSTPHPMVPFDCTDTFTSLGHAQVELFESARISFVEQELGLELWASVRHEGTLYKIGGAVVLAVRFRVHPLLSSATHNVRFRLPERVRAEMQWVDARTGLETQVKGERCSVPIKLLRCDALFVITSNITTLLEEACNDPEDLTPSNNIMVQFSVKMPPFTLMSQLHTSIALTQPATKRWRQILLNQNHDLEVIDLAKARAPGPQRTEAPHSVSGRWDGYVDGQPGVLLWRKWNTEQRKAIESIRKARGGFTLVTGPAGTGKTLVEQAMCRFFWQVGLHVIVLAPANSNVADFMQKLKKESRDINDGLRVFPSSAEVHLRDAIRREGPAVLDEKPVCEAPAPNSGVFEFEMVRASLNAIGEKYRGRDLGVQEQVWRTARESSLTLFEHLKDDHSRPIGSEIDMWEKLRECMRACEAGEFDWKDPNAVTAYEQCYKACKGHLIARSRLIVTTTGNVGCSDIQENWAQDKHGLYCKGVVIILDEACKDKEIDTLSALMCAGFRHKVTGMVMVGDDRQLEPTNTSAKGNVQFNPFHERSNIPLLSRMKREGFPCVELVEQHRMSKRISEWPFANFYPPGMRDAASTGLTLHEKQPGLHACLAKICEGHLAHRWPFDDKIQQDILLRTKYVEIAGTRDNSKLSAVVREHILAFFNHIFWPLHAYYGEKLHENVMIICAYRAARSTWEEAISYLQAKHRLPLAQTPHVVTIDSSQGTEAPLTFIDCSVQQYTAKYKRRDIGFVDDDKRMNVAFTRAQEVRWVLGGNCSLFQRPRHVPGDPAYVRYRDEVMSGDHTWVIGDSKLTNDGTDWLEKLGRVPVSLDVRFVDDMARIHGH